MFFVGFIALGDQREVLTNEVGDGGTRKSEIKCPGRVNPQIVVGIESLIRFCRRTWFTFNLNDWHQ